MEEEQKEVFKRVKVPVQKTAKIVLIVCSIFILLCGVVTLAFMDDALILGIFFVSIGAICLLLAFTTVAKQVKLAQQTNTYPETALELGQSSLTIVTDTTTTINLSEIKSVRGVRFVGVGLLMYKFYYYGTLFINLQDGTKIRLFGIDNVADVATIIKARIKK